jgi:hypothetical protein
MPGPGDASVRDAFGRIEQWSAGIEELVPGWLAAMDQVRSAKGRPGLSWPDWSRGSKAAPCC